MKIISWNVNGLRAIHKKGFLDWMKSEKPDVLCLQETKANPDQLPKDLLNVKGYEAHFNSAERKGYSGVAVYTKIQPKSIKFGMDDPYFDKEGRVIQVEFDDFILFNIYFPNGGMGPERLQFKMEFYYYLLNYLKKLKTKNIVICGDVNTAHTEIDLARPKQNVENTGFLPEERKWIDDLLAAGFFDTFRMFNKNGENYSYWDYKTKARERNVGWRIDYFFISKSMKSKIKDAFILNDVFGSDHCPVGIKIK